MTVYVYKSATGFPVIIDNYTITPEPGLQSKYQIEQLDLFIGESLDRYDDGVLVTADNSKPATLTDSRTITASDNGVTFNCSNALTITIPAGLNPRPSFKINPPASGVVTLAVSGGAQVNGGTSSVVCARATYLVGMDVVAYADSDGYGAIGAGAGGGGGSSTFTGLSDAATADIPAINSPISAALATKANVTTATNLSADRTITAGDDGVVFNCTTALTVTIPAGLTPKPNFIVIPPASGLVSIAFTGGATGNGDTSTLTYSRALFPSGVAAISYPDVTNGYGITKGETSSMSIGSNRTITSADDGVIFNCTTALTITIPASLTPRPSIIVNPPASGNVTIAVSGGAQINGATSSLTRTRTSNYAGVAIVPYSESDGYGVSGG